LLREQQDEEFAASLAVDQSVSSVTADSKCSNSEQLHEVRSDSADCHEDLARKVAEEEQEQLFKRRRLLADEFVSSAPELPTGSAIARLVLRLPSGERVERTFGSSESFSRVRDWVECCAYLPEARDRDLPIPKHFDLAISMPPRKFSSDDDHKNLGDLGLTPSAALLVIEKT